MIDLKFFSISQRKGRCHGNQFCLVYQTFSLRAEVSQDPLDRFSQSFHRMVGIELQINDRSSFFDILRDVAMATNLVAKMGQNYLPPALIALSFRNGMAHWLADTRINSSTNCSTSCEKMVKIGSVVFELKWGRKWKLSCKSAKICL